MSESGKAEFGLAMPFWIDTDAYTDRDRDMFVAGVEFQMVTTLLKSGWHGSRPIHPENESRLRMAAGRLNRKVIIERCVEDDSWSYLTTDDDPKEDAAEVNQD